MQINPQRIYLKRVLLAVVIGVAGLLTSTPASAQAARTWVSGVGDDANVCSRTAPCKTFAGAISKTNAGGEIDCLDPGSFGTVTIGKSIIISCANIGNGSILAAGGSGITINAGASDVVVLDGLDIAGPGNGNSGISFVSGGALIVRNTTIRSFSGFALFFEPSASATLNIDNSTFIGNGQGIDLYPQGSASVRANISRSQFSNNDYGVYADGSITTGGIFVSMRSTTVSNSRYTALLTKAGTATYSTIALDEVTVSGSGSYGLYATGQRSGMLVNNSTITNNQSGGVAPVGGGVIYSYGNNRVNGNNMNDGTFTGTIPLR